MNPITLFFNFARSFVVFTWAKWGGYDTLAPGPIANARLRVCRKRCAFYVDGQCRQCGCLAMSKTMLATERCPRGKWGRVWTRKP